MMNNKQFTKGSPDQLVHAIEQRIRQLRNPADDITSSRDSGKYEWAALADEVVEELLDEDLWATYHMNVDNIQFDVFDDPGKRNRVAQYTFYPEHHRVEGEPLVNQAYHIIDEIKMAVDDSLFDANASTTIVDSKTYATQLVEKIGDVLASRGVVDVEFRIEPTQDVIYAYQSTVNAAGEHTVVEYSIPFADLHMEDLDNIDEDVEYVVDNITSDDIQQPAVESCEKVEAAKSFKDSDGEMWYMVEQKPVRDSDGFMTDYTMYRNEDKSRYIFMFGDADMYEPDPSYADWEASSVDEAYEWFESYTGFEDEDDEEFEDMGD